MKLKLALLPVIILVVLIFSACQGGPSQTPTAAFPTRLSDTPTALPTPTPSPTKVPDTPTADPTALPSPTKNTPTPFSTPVLFPVKVSGTPTPSPTAINLTPEPTIPITRPIEILFKGILDCSPHGDFIKCADKNIQIEFEYPADWGELEAVLRTGGYAGYAYNYTFDGKTTAGVFPPFASGLSGDFSEGREGILSDFREGCAGDKSNLFPICQIKSSDVTWMIYFPDANYICGPALMFGAGGKVPFFRIEIDLPNNPTVNGLVFEAPFLSEQFMNQVDSDLYPLLGLEGDVYPTNCDEADRQAFDAQRYVLLKKILTRAVDDETLRHLDKLTHLANSIVFR